MVRGRAGEAESKHFSKNTSAVSAPRRQLQQSRYCLKSCQCQRSHFFSQKRQHSSLHNPKCPELPLTAQRALIQFHLQFRSWDNDREDKLGNLALSKPQSNSLGDLSRSSRERVFIAKVLSTLFTTLGPFIPKINESSVRYWICELWSQARPPAHRPPTSLECDIITDITVITMVGGAHLSCCGQIRHQAAPTQHLAGGRGVTLISILLKHTE